MTPETNPDEDRVLIELYGAINIFARKDPKRFNEVLS